MNFPEWLPEKHRPAPTRGLRKPLIERWAQPFAQFLHAQAGGGIALLTCTVVALVLANSRWGEPVEEFWETKMGFTVADWSLVKQLMLWINDGLMTIFFFVVGLEIKREFVFGELREVRKAALPAAAALGGMVVPAGIYLAMQWGQPASRGWGIPMATDIAFVVGFLALLGSRIPFSVKILLLTLAIVDDIGAVLVIAVAYTSDIEPWFLLPAALGFAACYGFNYLGVRPVPVYLVLGAAIWFCFLKSGVHPTVAGVMLGLLTPARAWFARRSLLSVIRGVAARLRRDEDSVKQDHHHEAVQVLTATARETIAPLDRLEHHLHPWVTYGIMPLFALANAGVVIDLEALTSPIAIAVAVGLVAGKPIGILVFSWIAVRIGVARLPSGVNWGMMVGAACLAGIGFTMSLFIAGLALDGELLAAGKLGILAGSIISAVLGCAILLRVTRPQDNSKT